MQLGFAAQSAFAGRKDWHSLVDALPCRPRKRLLRKLLTEIFRLKHSLYYLWSENHCRIRLYSFLKLFYSWTIFGKDIKIAPILFRKSAKQAALLQLSIERNGPLYAFSLYRSWYRVSFVQFFHCVPPSVGLAGRKERSNLCNSLA